MTPVIIYGNLVIGKFANVSEVKMEINQKRVYVNLRMVDGQVVMNVSRMTEVVHGLGLSCGDVFSSEQAGNSLVTIESSQLSPCEFRAWFDAKGLNVLSFGRRYGISQSEVRDLLWPTEKVSS